MDVIDARNIFKVKGVKFFELNEGMHFKIPLDQFNLDGVIDFWPNSCKFMHNKKVDKGIYKLTGLLEKMKLTPKQTNAARTTVNDLSSLIRLIRKWEDGDLSIQGLDNELQQRYAKCQ